MKLKDWFTEQYHGKSSEVLRKNRWQQRVASRNRDMHKDLDFALLSTNRNAQNKFRRILIKDAVTLLP